MRLITNADSLRVNARNIKAFVFDWDGVFNGGFKDLDGGSPFSEVGSMGVNMLRFSAFLKNGKMPSAAIISGRQNPYAKRFAEREHLHGVYMGFSDKRKVFSDFLDAHGLKAHEVAFVFDDILDLSIAKQAGIAVMMGGAQTTLLQEEVISRSEVSAITTLPGQQNGLREACEFIIDLMGNFREVVDQRVSFTGKYSTYLTERNTIKTQVQSA